VLAIGSFARKTSAPSRSEKQFKVEEGASQVLKEPEITPPQATALNDIYAQMLTANPDKRDFEAIEDDFRASKNPHDLIRRYSEFRSTYPQSPLTRNAERRIREIESKLERQEKRTQELAEYEGIPEIDLAQVHAYAEKLLGQTFRVEGNIRYSACHPSYIKNAGGNIFRISSNGVSILVFTDSQLYRFLMGSLQGKKGGIYGDFKISVSRDSDLNILYELLACRVSG